MVDFGIQIVVSSIWFWKKNGLILEDNAEIWWQKKGKMFLVFACACHGWYFLIKKLICNNLAAFGPSNIWKHGMLFSLFSYCFCVCGGFVQSFCYWDMPIVFNMASQTCMVLITWHVCVFITWHMCVHYMACVCSIHVMFWFQKIQIIFCQACGATIFLLPYNQSFAQSRCDVAMHKAHAHANILHGHISYMTFVECASPSVACVLAAWAHWFMLLILHAMGTSGANVPSEPYMQQWRESEEFCLGDHPPGAYLQCDAVGCTGRSWIWCWRLNERNQRCRHCRQFWSNVFLSSGYRFWAWQATRQWPAYLQL